MPGNNVNTEFFAGFNPISSILALGLFLLASNPEMEQRFEAISSAINVIKTSVDSMKASINALNNAVTPMVQLTGLYPPTKE